MVPERGAPVLVTGASGFLGSHLVERLVGRGIPVRCLVRESSNLTWLPRERVDLVYGEITRPESLEAAVAGVTRVFHLAGLTEAKDEARYLSVNATGTANLVRALTRRRQRPERFVLVSSLAAGGPSRSGRPRLETDPDTPAGAYGRSKLAGERALAGADFPWTVLRPPAVYGPRDRDFPKLFRLVRRGWSPRLTGPPQELSLVHVLDLVEGIAAAAESPAAVGRIFYLAHPEVVTWPEVARLAAEALGRPDRSFPLPRGCLLPLARGVGLIAALAGRPNPFPPDRVRDLLAPAWTCDPSAAAEAFGFRPKCGLRIGIPATVAWCREAGVV